MRSRESIEKELRQRIQRGTYPAGSRMPPHRTLQKELGASSVTLQRAFDRLGELGYVVARGSRGTFVAKALPHTSHIGVVFPEEIGKGSWNRFWSTAKRVGETWNQGPVRFRFYHIRNQQQDSDGHQQLCRDAAEGGLAGVVFLHAPHYLAGSPVLTQPLPRVIIAGRRRDVTAFDASAIEFSTGEPLEELVRRFAAEKRRLLAGITTPNVGFVERVRPLLRSLGMETRDEWWIGLSPNPTTTASAHDVARLLFSANARQRPDCLIISDDNLAPHVITGVLEAGIRIPRDLTIAAHANFPVPTPASVPCLRYGVDMEEILTHAIAEVQRLAAGGKPDVVRVAVRVRESRP